MGKSLYQKFLYRRLHMLVPGDITLVYRGHREDDHNTKLEDRLLVGVIETWPTGAMINTTQHCRPDEADSMTMIMDVVESDYHEGTVDLATVRTFEVDI